MFEMFATIVAACAAAIYGLSRSVFMSGVHRNLYRAAFIGIIILVYVTYRIYHYIKFKNIKKLNVDFDDYLYYDKYTSPLYRAGYFISYLVQNILFDYTYMKRNYNFCKGLDVYDGGVSEYYIKFRNTWYRYLKLTMIRHRISLKKLQAFSCDMKNEMIIAALNTPEERSSDLSYWTVCKLCGDYTNVSKECVKTLPRSCLYGEERTWDGGDGEEAGIPQREGC